jgi:hypothetical protein
VEIDTLGASMVALPAIVCKGSAVPEAVEIMALHIGIEYIPGSLPTTRRKDNKPPLFSLYDCRDNE